jgi:DnaJ family protein C protein 3
LFSGTAAPIRLAHLSNPSTASFMRMFRLAYFLLPAPTTPSSSHYMSTLKQCLHFDPGSKACLSAHRLAKSFDKTFAKIDKAIATEDWRGAIALILGNDKTNPLGDAFLRKYHEAMEEHTSPSALAASSSSPPIEFPVLSAIAQSPRRRDLLRALCRAYTNIQCWRAMV